ncbi:pentatricopeptide repeat-containing protein At2g03380, mitochondrial [Mercurialis annua]|uniref:pentatricopeptide repeat-containing protein At2g03380, mitochondrial n=1 Tax=Mercurialis annua TaxID=3986 RepID=UPI00215F5705|nr:pentatricopeptide repeat-containing protein At2g03380, mitochondrial [Mercurialis annua]
MVKSVISQLQKHINNKPFYLHCRNHFNLTLKGVASVQSVFSNPSFHLLGLCKNISSLKNVHGFLIVNGLVHDLSCSTKLISLYGSFGYVKDARSMFDRMPEPDFYSWKVMLRWYFLNGLYWEIIRFFTRMRSFLIEVDNVVFSIVLKACSELRDINEGRKLHCLIMKAGNPDSFVLTGLTDMYAKCGEIECSCCVFDENLDRNVVSWTSMIAGYVHNDCPAEGLVLFNRMREVQIEANEYTLGSLLTVCTKLGALHQGKWFHGFAIKGGVQLNSFLVTSLLDMYVKCGEIRDARLVFDELSSIDIISWTAMIVGYTQSGFPYEALKLFMDKKRASIMPNDVTIASVLSACAQMENLNFGRSIHGLGLKLGFAERSVVNALVDMYAKCHMNGDASYIFETASDKDVVSWNSIIYGCSQNKSSYEALELFNRMRKESVSPDAVTLVSIFSACASLGALRVGSSLHAYFIKEGLLSSNVYVGTALLTFYAKCGDAKSARAIFDGMREKNTVTWSAMIGGYGIQGDACGSLSLFDDMLKEELKPNEVIFTTILSACSHTGMIGEGWDLFNSMCQEYNIVPSMKHYTCMVDLLARSGRLEEAWNFIEKTPVQPDVSMFGAFLHGCGLHSRFDLGEMAIKRMQELHPDDASYYVLMCNLYASDGRWNQVKQVREMMKKRDLVKSPGSSVMEMDSSVDLSFPRVASLV